MMKTHYRLLILLLVIVVAVACGQPELRSRPVRPSRQNRPPPKTRPNRNPAPAIETVIFSDLNWTSAQVQNGSPNTSSKRGTATAPMSSSVDPSPLPRPAQWRHPRHPGDLAANQDEAGMRR